MPVSQIQNASLASGVPSVAKLPAGSVLQVVSANVLASYQTTTSSSYVSTDLTASITPTSSSSKILILVSTCIYSSTAYTAIYTIYRNSTNLAGSQGFTETNIVAQWTPASMTYLDSPATTSSTAYRVYMKASNSQQIYIGGDTQTQTITLLEIAA